MIEAKTIEYKKTGLDWMPEVPKHWEVRRLKTFVDYVNRGNTPNYVETSEFKVVNQATFSKGFWDESNIRFSDFGEKELKGKIRKNDILLASTGGGVLGKTHLFKLEYENYVADSHITILRDSQNRFVPEFFYYILSINYKLINGILAEGSTNQTELQKDWLLNLKIALPPKTEQDAIVQYIKAQEEKINLFIQKKQRFIELLKEQRLSIVFKTVTKGINANVPFKETNIDWIGKIPRHWELKRMKYLCKISNGMDCEKEDVGEFPVYGSGGIFGWTNNFIYDKPSVLLGRKGTIDKPIFVTEPFWTVDTAFFTKIFEEAIEPSFFFQLCCCIPFESLSTKTALPSMTQTALYQVKMPLPPLEEQKQIVSHIKTETATIDTAIAKAEREIELIREYKEAMIAEAVMGKRK